MKIYLKEIKERFPEFEIFNYDDSIYFETFNHDSRVNIPKAMFIPIIGESFNGHDFVKEALDNGCVASLFQKNTLEGEIDFKKPIIIVEDIMIALEKILNIVREKIDVPILAITGSTGKTTTREMLSKILSLKGKVLTSSRNYNTLWGNAYVLTQYTNQKYIVLEFGMDKRGEIASQCRAIKPNLGILLNVGHVHAQRVGGIENVYLAKKELADYLKENSKLLILNRDDDRLREIVKEFDKEKIFTIGSIDADMEFSNVMVKERGTYFTLKYLGSLYEVALGILGKGYAYNALASIACAFKLGFNIPQSVKQIKNYNGFEGRFQIVKKSKSLTVVNDAYNANPTSMKMALETFQEIWCKREDIKKILILGDMKELGVVSEQEHRKIGDIVKSMSVDEVYYLGDNYESFGTGQKLSSLKEAIKILKSLGKSKQGAVVLLKASNGTQLYTVIDSI
jgi:UDP-N-acetylmuramoyl-tripeptide--D-alanyl-D-alanine ligase